MRKFFSSVLCALLLLGSNYCWAGIDRVGNDLADTISIDNDLGINAYPWTVCAWVDSDQTYDNHVIFGLADKDAATIVYGIGIRADYPSIMARNTTFYSADGTTTAQNQFLLICGVFASNTSKLLYVNGVNENTLTTSVTMNSAVDRATIGYFGDSTPSDPCNAQIYEIYVWNTGLSTAQILDLFNSKMVGYGTMLSSANLVAWYPMDERPDGSATNGLYLHDYVGGFHMSMVDADNDMLWVAESYLSYPSPILGGQ